MVYTFGLNFLLQAMVLLTGGQEKMSPRRDVAATSLA
jgi:hypothetical protein